MQRRLILIVPTLRARRYTQVQPSQKSRHFGKDAEIQAMEGNIPVLQCLIYIICQLAVSHPWIRKHLSLPRVAFLGRWISASAEMTGIQDLCITTSAEHGNACPGAPAPRNPPPGRLRAGVPTPERGNHQNLPLLEMPAVLRSRLLCENLRILRKISQHQRDVI